MKRLFVVLSVLIASINANAQLGKDRGGPPEFTEVECEHQGLSRQVTVMLDTSGKRTGIVNAGNKTLIVRGVKAIQGQQPGVVVTYKDKSESFVLDLFESLPGQKASGELRSKKKIIKQNLACIVRQP